MSISGEHRFLKIEQKSLLIILPTWTFAGAAKYQNVIIILPISTCEGTIKAIMNFFGHFQIVFQEEGRKRENTSILLTSILELFCPFPSMKGYETLKLNFFWDFR